MAKTKIDFNIPTLIIKSFQNELSNSDKKKLDHWLESERENSILYEQLKEYNHLERITFFNKLNKSLAWKNIRTATYKQKTIGIKTILRYAAVLLLPIAIATILIWESIPNTDNNPISEINIPAGYSKAVLKMGDGRIIDLEKAKTIRLKDKDGTIISSDSKTLSFKAPNTIEEKLLPPVMEEISIPRKGEYKTVLPDGTKVWLNSETVLKFPSRFTGKERNVTLKKGEAYFEVTHDKDRPFILTTEKSKVKVLGTSFNIRAYEDEVNNLTTLIEGSVEIQHRYDDLSKTILKPGEQALITSVNRRIKIKKVETNYYTAWTEGKFAFYNERLDNILTRLERWYDIDMDFLHEEAKAYRFTGNLPRYDNISVILKMLEDVYTKIEFNYVDNKIFVRKK